MLRCHCTVTPVPPAVAVNVADSPGRIDTLAGCAVITGAITCEPILAVVVVVVATV